TDFAMPIAGGCLATSSNLLPNAPREYRFGIHEGMDFYSYDNCVDVPGGAEVLAVKDGTVIRADHGFVEKTAAELDELLTRVATQGYTDDESLDEFRGRQVWVDHGGGIVTRYAHLGGIPENIREGVTVSQGDVIAFVGDSGTPEAVTAPGIENHLHLEIRVGDSYLGAGLPEDQVRFLWEAAFSGP
ncbi:MAG: M23 family metallopeptidase, partial [Dehalococcoidia bacterium]